MHQLAAREKKVHGSSALSAALKAESAAAAAADAAATPCGSPEPAAPLKQGLPCPAPQAQSPLHLSPSRLLSASLSNSSSSSTGRLPRVANILPFWSCFSGAGGQNETVAVSAEVGIRPSFYWLDADVSEEERMYAEANARWMKSDCQDDAVVLSDFASLPRQIFAGVFDGHGPHGRSAAKFASTQIPALLSSSTAMASRAGERKRLRAMREACASVDAAMHNAEACGFDASLSGTTACFAVVCGRRVSIANTGDSRCVLARRAPSGSVEAMQMTWDAKPDHPEELKRIRMAGGVVCQLLDESGERVGAHRVFRRGDDVLPGLAMSRSLGDLYAHAVGVSNEPVLSSHTLTDRDLFLVLGTDGLWDIMTNEEVVDFIERYRNGRAQDLSCAEALTLEAQERWKARHEEALVDDISVAIIHLAPLGPVDRSAHVRSPLAHAASCNDEANALFHSWQQDADRNPSNHAPRRYFPHLYPEGSDPLAAVVGEDAGSGGGGGGSGEVQRCSGGGLRRMQSEGAALAAAALPLAPVRSLNLSQSAGAGGGILLAAAEDVAAQRAQQRGPVEIPAAPAAPATPFCSELAALGVASAPGCGLPMPCLARAASPEDPSSRSSMDCSDSEPCQYRHPSSSKFSGAFSGRASSFHNKSDSFSGSLGALGQVRSSPIPCGGPSDVDPLFRPIRKAYPSMNGGLCSFKSSVSMLDAMQDTPRSTEGGDSRGSTQSRNFGYEGKLRGGLPRTLSAPVLAASAVAKWPSFDGAPAVSSGSVQAGSLDERTLAQLASCGLADSPSESSLSSPYPTVSPVGPPLGAPLPGFPPYLVQANAGPGPPLGKGGLYYHHHHSQQAQQQQQQAQPEPVACSLPERGVRGGLLRSVSESAAEGGAAQRGGLRSLS